MLKNTLINRAATLKVAQALGDLNERVVYVGGAIVSLYIDDPTADDVRPTKDIDITMEIASLGQLEAIREALNQKGFHQSSEDNVICRFRYEDIKVDVMATKAVGWAPANPWFAPGFNSLVQFEIEHTTIKCLSLPYYLATKFTAFYDRGIRDPRTSRDFEDIVYVLNYTSDWVGQMQASNEDVKQYLTKCFSDILEDSTKQEAILGNLFHENQDQRFRKITAKLEQICRGTL